MSRDEINEIASSAADKAISKAFLVLGIDTSDPEAILKTQADFRHLRLWRESVEAVRRKGLLTVVTVLITGALGYLLLTFKPH